MTNPRMKVLVSDSSVLIEFSKRELLDKIFELEYQFAVPDLLFNEELIDLGQYSRQDLVTFGLLIEALDPDGVAMAISYQSRRSALSLVDCFALALANCQGCVLLTEDRTMRGFAQAEGIPHHDILWVVDNMSAAGILSAAQVTATLEAMRDDPRCPVPDRELALRLRRLGG